MSRLVIATDSDEIRVLAESFGAEVLMTDPEIANGSERVAAATELLGGHFECVVNIQGDMPFIRPEVIDSCIDFFCDRKSDFDMTTVATSITEEEMYHSVSDVKVVIGEADRALYFSRASVPHSRDGTRPSARAGEGSVFGFKHFGLYVFGEKALKEYRRRDATELETIECLEQLRLIARGFRVGVVVVDRSLTENSVEVDTASDLERAEKIAGR